MYRLLYFFSNIYVVAALIAVGSIVLKAILSRNPSIYQKIFKIKTQKIIKLKEKYENELKNNKDLTKLNKLETKHQKAVKKLEKYFKKKSKHLKDIYLTKSIFSSETNLTLSKNSPFTFKQKIEELNKNGKNVNLHFGNVVKSQKNTVNQNQSRPLTEEEIIKIEKVNTNVKTVETNKTVKPVETVKTTTTVKTETTVKPTKTVQTVKETKNTSSSTKTTKVNSTTNTKAINLSSLLSKTEDDEIVFEKR